MSLARVKFVGGLPCNIVRNTFPTVWCIRSQMELDCGFFAVDCTSLTLNIFSSHWNSCPMNSPPLSCTHRMGRGYLDNHACTNLFLTWADVLLSIRINSTKLEAVSMQVSALNSTSFPCTLTFYEPIRSMATSSQGAIRRSRSGNKPNPLPGNSCLRQCSHQCLSIVCLSR